MSDEQQRNIFARNLTAYVQQSGKQQQEIASILGFNQKTFNGWCRALSMPTMGKVQKIADYFGIRKSDLLDDHTGDDGFRLTAHECDIIKSFRKADTLTKQMVLRLLDMEPKQKELEDLA